MSYKNKQPYYHQVVILFTSTGADEEEFNEFLASHENEKFFNFSIEEWDEGEPGDPADLL